MPTLPTGIAISRDNVNWLAIVMYIALILILADSCLRAKKEKENQH